MFPERMGIMGGTFDPVHIGHLRVAQEAVEMLNLDVLTFIPAAAPPHKPGKKTLAFEHRWRMLDLAVKGNPRFRLSDVEKRLSGKSYSVVTLRKLREEMGHELELYFLVGMDAFLEMDTWWHYEELFRLARVAVLSRPGYHEEDLHRFLKEKISPRYTYNAEAGFFNHPELFPVHYLKNVRLEISSTQIRQMVVDGRSLRYLVPDEVIDYIREKNLYRGVF
ncbi:MAG: nicotinate-nucleotide adenylyltransferase [Syntrophobacteraceae bacterium]